MNLPNYFIKGIPITLTTPQKALEVVRKYNHLANSGNYICLAGLNLISLGHKNNELRDALRGSYMNPLHGKSIEWMLKMRGCKNIETVDGVFLLENLLNENLSHYFYGTNDRTLSQIKLKIESEFPKAIIKGYKAPPYLEVNEIKNNSAIQKDIEEINRLKPNIIWVGTGGIKQSILMYYYHSQLDNSLMIGVGAVFDYFVGNIQLSPTWVKKIGLRWLYRDLQQPRLIKRQFSIIPFLISLFITGNSE